MASLTTHQPVPPVWTLAAPIAAWLLFLAGSPAWGVVYWLLLTAALIFSVLASVHHAEVIAARVGEPFGALVLAIAITAIEVSLIIALMLTPGHETATLARDTVFAAEMILITAIVGACLLLGGLKFKEQTFSMEGVGASLNVLIAISALTLILPNYTSSIPGPYYNHQQLAFVAVVSLVLYGTFLCVQTTSLRHYFLSADPQNLSEATPVRPGKKAMTISLVFLLVSLSAVVILAELLAPGVETIVENAGAPKSLVGIIIAMVVLLPEGLSAIQAANHNQLQSSLNLALGSALASIGLTIPAVALVSLYKGLPMTLGIDAKSTVLFVLSLFIILISLRTGRTNLLQGAVLLVIFAVYLFTTIIP